VPDWLRRRTLVSVVVCTKNGMPHIRDAMTSLARQTYRRFEVVVQDAASTDGTAEFLSVLPFERLEVVSEPDGGIGDAFNRAFARCSGALVTTLDADNLLEPKALERAVALYREHPRAAALYGAVQVVNADADPIDLFVSEPFDVGALMRCELVPPFSTSFFSPRVCGAEFRCDASLETCADFDLWLRLADHEIVCTKHVLGRTRLSDRSMTRDARRYEQFCRDKISALENHLARHPEQAGERAEAIAGIYCWAAESLLALEGPSERCGTMLERAATAAPSYGRLESSIARFAEATRVSEPSASL
jgi:glycosyltransferase involved in cell wall biosynthesis